MPSSTHIIAPSNPLGSPSDSPVRMDQAEGVAPRSPARIGWYEGAKATFDLVMGAVLLVLATPVILLAALAIRLTSEGPAFYIQTRLGRGGQPFRIIKLRTMYHDAEKKTGPKWSLPGDARITPLGRFLRVTHLDELPQLINVLRMEMSLVGPRPERPEIIPKIELTCPNYRDRLWVRPGVTGLAQLRLPADTCVSKVGRKLAYDLHYIRTYGLWLDLCLMACTVLKMTGMPLNWVLDLCRVPGHKAVGIIEETPSDSKGRKPLPPKG